MRITGDRVSRPVTQGVTERYGQRIPVSIETAGLAETAVYFLGRILLERLGRRQAAPPVSRDAKTAATLSSYTSR